eukprot:scaffold559010_cov11-Prasinocladus_malaysianus.AAC.1
MEMRPSRRVGRQTLWLSLEPTNNSSTASSQTIDACIYTSRRKERPTWRETDSGQAVVAKKKKACRTTGRRLVEVRAQSPIETRPSRSSALNG